MSVQLAIFPQTHFSNQLMVDGQDFINVPTATNYDVPVSSATALNIMNNAYPSVPNLWYKMRWVVNGTPAVANSSGGSLTLNAVSSIGVGARCGVYQQLSGLVVGQSYTLTIQYASAPGFIIGFNATTTSLAYQSYATDTTTSFDYVFTALSINDTVMIQYQNTSASNLIISKMSISSQTDLTYEGQVICDLYENEEIPLTLSVDNFKNVAEKLQSYSKDFNLPATKRNNKLFGNIFEITRTVANPYDFNPYIQTRAVLKQHGIIIFDGFLKLINIEDRNGEISYNVNLYAQTIALADTLKSKTFDHINFDELAHTYDIDSIEDSWSDTTGLSLTSNLSTSSFAYDAALGVSKTNVLKYPFVDWSGQILYANGSTGSSATIGTPELTELEQAFRPFIKVKYLVDRIFSESEYTYSSSVFESADFSRLFMDFNFGGERMPSIIDSTNYNLTRGTGADVNIGTGATAYSTLTMYPFGVAGGVATSSAPPTYNTSGTYANYIVETGVNILYHLDYTFSFNPAATGSINAESAWEYYNAASGLTTYYNLTAWTVLFTTSTQSWSGSFFITLNAGDRLRPVTKNLGTGSGTPAFINVSARTVFTVSSAEATSATLNAIRGSLNQWEFLKGLFTMFNLVTLQDDSDPANLIIEPYADVFIKTTKGTSLEARSISQDWTDKVDEKDITLTPLNSLKKKTIFKYAEDESDYIFNVYKKSTRGHLYGSRVFSAEQLTLLEGEDEIIAEPFAATVSKPLWSQFVDFIIPTIYSANDDGVTSPFNNKPRILYQMNTEPVTSSTTYFAPAQNGKAASQLTDFFTFSHLTDIPTVVSTPPAASDTVDFNFGECQLIQPIGDATPSNLFNTYWLPYFNQLYDSDTKTMEIKVNLKSADIASFKFSDYVMIKNRSYRVNRIDYKPNDLSTVEFILLN